METPEIKQDKKRYGFKIIKIRLPLMLGTTIIKDVKQTLTIKQCYVIKLK